MHTAAAPFFILTLATSKMYNLKPLFSGNNIRGYLNKRYPGLSADENDYGFLYELKPAGDNFSAAEFGAVAEKWAGNAHNGLYAVLIRDSELRKEYLVKKDNALHSVWELKDGREMDLSRLMVMGILNVTPDSFSDGGLYNSPGEAIKHAAAMTEAGTDIIDIGGLSTRPDSAEIPVDDEIARVIPVIRQIREFNKNVLISADTYRSEVAAAAMEAGADIINDISGGAFDPAIREVAAHYDAPYIIMHTPGKPSEMQKMTDYDELMSTIYHYLSEKGKEAEAKGVKRIIADPGIGFGKTIDQNFEILSRMEELLYLGYPLLIGLSRKSFIGKTLDLDTGQRDIPTSILEGFSVSSGARIIRTHNILHASYLKQLINRILQY